MEAKAGKTKPVSQLWDDIDAEWVILSWS
jgi:hypothetical protein